jgi:Flp pilus assembly protein TadB
VVRVLVVPVAGSVDLVLVVLVVVHLVLVLVVLVADLVVLVVLVVLVAVVLVAAVLVVAVTVNAVRQRRSHVLVVVKTSMKCCHRQPRRTRRATHQFLKVFSSSNVVLRRKSLHQN